MRLSYLLACVLALAGCQFAVDPPTLPASSDVTTPSPLPADPTTSSPPTEMTDGGATDPVSMPPPEPVPPQTPKSASYGDACTGPDTCKTGLTCMMQAGRGKAATPLPGGYCSKSCSFFSPCETGFRCFSTNPDGSGICGPAACPAAGCRTGYICCRSLNTCAP